MHYRFLSILILSASLAIVAGVISCVDTSSPPEEMFTTSQAVYSCTSHCDCPSGLVCSEGSCTLDFGPFPECYCAARDCAAGQACIGGFCTSGGGGGGGSGGGGGGGDEN